MIGELPLNQLANLAKQNFSLSVSLWFQRLQLEHGDDYCTSWYEMKEVLRRRFAPPLEPKKNILSSSENSYMVESEFASATQFEKHASTNQPAIMGLPSDLPTTTSIVGADVPMNASISDISSTLEQQVCEDSCDVADNEPLLESNDDATTGFSLMSHEVQRDGTIVKVMGQGSNIFQSECNIKGKV